MLTNAGSFFRTYFPKLAHVDAPYHWQEQCFQDMLADRLRDSLALPTGTGKTAIMQIWLLALAFRQIAPDPAKPDIPRRLAWVVNRRVVVDQATEEALRISEALDALPENDPLREALEKLSGGDGLLAVSTLRGQRADNGHWCANPARAAIVVGTVDKIGSRLLFRGYGDGRYYRPSHAGLLGVDTLIVNDEAHLSPAFASLLRHIQDLAPAARLQPKTFRVLLLSATTDGATTSFEADLASNARFRSLYTAEKRLYLHEVASAKDVENRLFDLAVEPGAARTIVFVEKPEDASKMAERLRAATKSERVALLTGTMRGYERDLLTGAIAPNEHDDLAGQRAVFKQFMPGQAPPAEPHWLVATSAGEVGVNITSERLVSLLVESDHLIQRFGRLNRFPGGGAGEAHIVTVATEKKSTLVETLAYLRSLPLLEGGARDISCRTLNEHRPPADSASPPPKAAVEPETWLLDLWSQTTTAGPAIPQVAPWLHGKAETEAPETEVLWREDVTWLARDGVSNDDRERALEHYPVIPLERLSEPSSRVHKKLQEMSPEPGDARVIIVASDGSISAKPIREIEPADIENGRLLLPPGCGSLANGMFRSRRPEPDAAEPYDIADWDPERPRRRYHVRREDGVWWAYRIGSLEETLELDGTEEALNLAEPARIAAENALGPHLCITVPKGEDEPPEYLLYFKPPPRRKSRTVEVPLGDHLAAVAEKAAELAGLAGLPHLKELFRCAGQYHDLGKRNELWQRAMGGDPEKPLAKTRAAPAPFLLAGFRHELESLSLAGTEEALVLHLVASHHGWARPHFEPKAYSRETLHRSRETALAAARRFGELQAAWGHWGLAYLEAVFKAADAMASDAEQEGSHA